MTTPRALGSVLLASLLACTLACSSKAEADALCDLAREVSADTSVPAEQKYRWWIRRARDSAKGRKLSEALELIDSMTTADPAFIEAMISDAIGETWTCPTIDELGPPLDRPPPPN